MNNITVSPVIINPFVQFYLLFRDLPVIVGFYSWGLLISFIFGFIGNISSLLTFFRPTLRNVSTGCLFIVLAISDIICLLIYIFDFVEFGLKIPLGNLSIYNELCRFRWFVLYVAQLCSAWILVFISIDRWIRTRFPFKSKSLCTPKNALISVGIFLLIDIGLHSHLLMPFFGGSIPGVTTVACGPSFFNLDYLTFFYKQWAVMQVFISSLIPAILMVIFVIDIFISVRSRKQAIAPASHTQQGNANNQRRNYVQRQMLLLMFSTIVVFLLTTLPLAIAHMIGPQLPLSYEIWVNVFYTFAATTWSQSLCYAVNFYVHCLTSKLFRSEFKQQLKLICLKTPNIHD